MQKISFQTERGKKFNGIKGIPRNTFGHSWGIFEVANIETNVYSATVYLVSIDCM